MRLFLRKTSLFFLQDKLNKPFTNRLMNRENGTCLRREKESAQRIHSPPEAKMLFFDLPDVISGVLLRGGVQPVVRSIPIRRGS